VLDILNLKPYSNPKQILMKLKKEKAIRSATPVFRRNNILPHVTLR
jgi:hypothetical protein